MLYIKKILLRFCMILLQLFILLMLWLWTCHGSYSLVLQSTGLEDFQNLSLAPGTYTAYLSYDSDRSDDTVLFDAPNKDTFFLSDTLNLYTWRHSDQIQLWVLQETSNINLVVTNDSNVSFSEIRLYHNSNWRKILWVFVLLIFFVMDFIFWICTKYLLPSSNKLALFLQFLFLLVALLLSCLPLLMHGIAGDDVVFHLERIEGLSETLFTGQFPVRIYSSFFDGAGYCISVFYGDYLLYPAAILHQMGFPLQTCLKGYYVFTNFLTLWIAWYSFSKILKNRWILTFTTTAYVLSLYRFCDLYRRAAVGELTAMIFMPLVLCGFYLLFTRPKRNDSLLQENRDSVPIRMIALGMTGILTSHIVSSVLLAFFLFLWCLFYLPLLFQKRTLFSLLKAVLLSICLSAFFLVPFLDYIVTQPIEMTSSVMGLFLSSDDKWITIKNLFAVGIPTQNAEPFGVFYILLWFLFGLWNLHHFRRSKESQTFYLHMVLFLLTGLFICMTTSRFPWGFLTKKIPAFSLLMSTIQFSFRFAEVAVFLCVLEGGLLLQMISIKPRRTAFYLPICFFAVFSSAILSVHTFFSQPNQIYIYDKAGLSIYYSYGYAQGYDIADGFYLPVNADITLFQGMDPISSDKDLQIDTYSKKGQTITFHCVNSSESSQTLTVPLLYYKGYTAYNMATGEQLTVTPDSHSIVSVTIPAGFQDDLIITYKEPWYWRIAEFLSLFCLVFLIKHTYYRKDIFHET